MARRESTWTRLQLSLFDTSHVRPSALDLPRVTRAPEATLPTPVPAAEPSRTRLIVDAVRRRLPGARVQLTDNKTVLLSQSERDGVRVVRIHQMFLDAPAGVREAMATFLSRGDRRSGSVIDAFIEERGHLLAGAGRALKDDAHQGEVHDLLPLFHRINERYFGGAICAEIGWGQSQAPRRRRTSITFGSWDQRSRRIVIHPVLDQPSVPALCVERVVHHEMLHAHHGERRDAHGRRVVHGTDFRADEARFDGAGQAAAWFDAHLDSLLRWKPGTALRL